MLIVSLVVVAIGGIIEFVPVFLVKSNIPTITSVKPYSPLELEGRDLYIREGCVGCHSQMIRPFRSETERYGEYSKAGEYVYDHPFLWGSKRTGPDLAHESQIKPSVDWHKRHLINPQATVNNSIMPPYPWLFEESAKLNSEEIVSHMKALSKVGVPYTDADYSGAKELVDGKLEGDALIAYLILL